MFKIKKDCFAYSKWQKDCIALKELYCAKENCKFYKNENEVDLVKIEHQIRDYANRKEK